MAENNGYTFPPVKRETLENGICLLLVEDHEQEGITLAFQMPFGEFCDPVSFEGTAELTAGMMLKGPKHLAPEEFSEKLEHAGAVMFSDVGDEHCIFGCKMLARSADLIFPIFRDMLADPGLRPKELSRLKREMITGLQAELADPMSIANRHFGAVLCGKGHPVGRSQTIRSVKKIGIRHIKEFHDAFISPANAILVVAGDFDTRGMMKKLKEMLATWKKKSVASPVVGGPLPPLLGNAVRLIDKPDLSQMSLILGHPACSELDPARDETALANYILGGGNFSSRLMAQIRSHEGKTYGISSQLSLNRKYGIFSIATSTQNNQAAFVLKAIMDVYHTFADGGVSDEELEKAKQFATGNMAFQLEGIVNVAEKLLWLQQFGRDISYIERFNERIATITKEAVNAAIGKYLSSSFFAIVAVGKKEEIMGSLQAYGAVHTVRFRADP